MRETAGREASRAQDGRARKLRHRDGLVVARRVQGERRADTRRRTTMIHEVAGDLLLSKAAVLAHGVAPHDDFKHGLALALRERWPAMYRDFRHHCKTASPKAGDVWLWSGVGPAGPIRIATLLTQEPPAHAGEHAGKAHIEWVNQALRRLQHLATEERFESLALPRLATGVGGLDWSQVRPLVEAHLGALGLPVWVYATYRPGVKAEESVAVGKRGR
jgi:O-acetyl-ADP-ribose deacetylase (regulator of RNase III)